MLYHWTQIRVEIFSLERFLLNAHQALIELRKVRTQNLKFRTDLQDIVMDGWSVTQQMIVYKGRLLKKILKLKIEASPVNADHYMAFKTLQLIWLQTLVAFDSESCETSFPSFCAPPQSLLQMPFLEQVVDLDLLLCTGIDQEHADLFLYFYSETHE